MSLRDTSSAGRTRHGRLKGVLFMALWSCGLDVSGPGAPGSADLSLLFIGNSLTYTNDLPGIVERLLEEHGGIADVYTESVSLPNFGLQDHWEGLSNARDRIRSGGWDYVVMQQGPSATTGRPSLLEYSQRFTVEIVSAGGRPAMYMVWPSAQRSFDFDGVSDSYRTAAAQIGGRLFPAGEAWRAAWARDSSLSLYGSDGFHPSLLGTYLAAVVIFEQLTDRDPASLPARIPTVSGSQAISELDAQNLHSAAKEANAAFALSQDAAAARGSR